MKIFSCMTAAISLAGCLLLPVSLMNASAAEPVDAGATQGGDALAGHLEIGTRMSAFWLVDSEDHGGFLGSIDKLNEEQNFWPYKVFVDWMFTPEWGLEFTWEGYAAETETDSTDSHSDGDLDIGGPMLLALWRHPNETIYTPYVTAGLGYMFSQFDEASWWELGYASKESWQSLGSPNTVRNGIERDIDVDDEIAYIVGGGSDIRLADNWHLDASMRFMYTDIDARFSETRNGVEIAADHGHFSMANLTFSLGARYAF